MASDHSTTYSSASDGYGINDSSYIKETKPLIGTRTPKSFCFITKGDTSSNSKTPNSITITFNFTKVKAVLLKIKAFGSYLLSHCCLTSYIEKTTCSKREETPILNNEENITTISKQNIKIIENNGDAENFEETLNIHASEMSLKSIDLLIVSVQKNEASNPVVTRPSSACSVDVVESDCINNHGDVSQNEDLEKNMTETMISKNIVVCEAFKCQYYDKLCNDNFQISSPVCDQTVAPPQACVSQQESYDSTSIASKTNGLPEFVINNTNVNSSGLFAKNMLSTSSKLPKYAKISSSPLSPPVDSGLRFPKWCLQRYLAKRRNRKSEERSNMQTDLDSPPEADKNYLDTLESGDIYLLRQATAVDKQSNQPIETGDTVETKIDCLTQDSLNKNQHIVITETLCSIIEQNTSHNNSDAPESGAISTEEEKLISNKVFQAKPQIVKSAVCSLADISINSKSTQDKGTSMSDIDSEDLSQVSGFVKTMIPLKAKVCTATSVTDFSLDKIPGKLDVPCNFRYEELSVIDTNTVGWVQDTNGHIGYLIMIRRYAGVEFLRKLVQFPPLRKLENPEVYGKFFRARKNLYEEVVCVLMLHMQNDVIEIYRSVQRMLLTIMRSLVYRNEMFFDLAPDNRPYSRKVFYDTIRKTKLCYLPSKTLRHRVVY